MPFDAPSQTRIVNAALAELGSTSRISNIGEDSNQARRAKALWPDILRELLDAHPWNFALRRRMLNEHGTPPTFGYARRFKLPEDLVRWLPGQHGDPDWYEAEQEDDSLLSDGPAPFPCRYIAYVDEVPKWTPSFVRLMILKLAASMAEGVTQSQEIKDRLEDRAEKQLRLAKRRDGLATGRKKASGKVARSDWIGASRRSWHGPRG